MKWIDSDQIADAKDGAIGGGRVQGRVKWWSRTKGYGFITCDQVEEDVFVHYQHVVEGVPGDKHLHEGERVEFDLVHNRGKGWMATAVTSAE